ncbi:hypothetical protein [Streptomyces griseorubiginosus]|uniref:hypothetical protein n=1 Tax=Streptomyces griseorubiginosus TaxID=67304 RepID=UPI00340DA104
MAHSTAASAHTAGRALRLLDQPDLRHQPAPIPQARRATATAPSVPLNLSLFDDLTHTVSEVADHARRVNPAAGPLPDDLGRLYDWWIDNTSDADTDEQAFRDTVIERHRLEHAIRLGQTEEVCKNPCPGCGCWGLEWDGVGNRALCLNRRCRTPDGYASTWTLGRLAVQKVQRTEMWRRNAT